MFTPGFDPILYHKVRSQELMREAQHYRMVQEALRSRSSKASLVSKLMVAFGERLVILGTSMGKINSISQLPESRIQYDPSPSKGC